MEIRQRLDYFLAKIAGKDVDIADLTPPQAINPTEELMLDIADRVADVEEAAEEATEAATVSKAGVVKMAAKVSEAASTAPTAEEFKALLDALKNAGIMAK